MAPAAIPPPTGRTDPPATRRGLGAWSWLLLAVGVGVLLAAFAAYLRPPLVEYVDVGPVAQYGVGAVRHYRFVGGAYVPVADGPLPPYCVRSFEWRTGFFVVRRLDGFVAFLDRSTHWAGAGLSHQPTLDPHSNVRSALPGSLVDTCGQGWFTPDQGLVAFGPASRPLPTLPVRIGAGRVLVDTRPSALRVRPDPAPAAATAA